VDLPVLGQSVTVRASGLAQENDVKTAKDSIDLGIIVSDAAKALAFYRDALGLEQIAEMAMPNGRMYRLLCGTTHLKIINFEKTPSGKAAPGGPMEALGLRYFTIHVPDLKGLIAQLESKGIKPFMPITEIRPGVTIAMVSDPDGNTVEFLQPA
jgi:catechol 2,3-dioxygenase-like lactoylglutathione lyase family enzyme